MKARIVHVALLIAEQEHEGEIEDGINEILRPLLPTSRSRSGPPFLLDYAFNTDGNTPELTSPAAYEYVENEYEEGTFIQEWITKVSATKETS